MVYIRKFFSLDNIIRVCIRILIKIAMNKSIKTTLSYLRSNIFLIGELYRVGFIRSDLE